MIRNQVFNLEKNLREAARYRLGLRNSIEQTDKRRDLESLLLSKKNVFNRLRFFNAETRKKLSAEIVSFSFKNFNYFFYYCGENQEAFLKTSSVFTKEMTSYIEGLNEEILKLSEVAKESNLELNSKYTKVKVYRRFLEKSFLEQYDYIDTKNEKVVTKTEKLDTTKGMLQLPVLFKSKVHPRSIVFLKEKTTASDIYFQESVNKLGEVNFTIVKLNNHTNGVFKKTKPVKLSLSLKLGLKQKVNKIAIKYNGELPIDIVKNKILYKTETGYTEINCDLYKESQEGVILFFDEIETSEIQLGFEQSKYFDNINISKSRNSKLKKMINKSSIKANFYGIEEESVRIYSFEIASIELERVVYKSFGLHREKDFLTINKPLTMQMKTNLISTSNNCFIEKEAHIVLYGDVLREAFKNPKSIYEKTPKLNTIICLSQNDLVEKEYLVFKNKQAKCRLYPNLRDSGNSDTIEDRIKVYKEGVLLTLGEEYDISLDEGSSTISPNASFRIIESYYSERVAGDFYIELKSKPNSTDTYTIEYLLDRNFYLEDSKSISMIDGEVVFGEDLENSVGFIRPRIIMRSSDKENSSSIINEISILVEELESNENNYIEFETFEEREVRSTNNVV